MQPWLDWNHYVALYLPHSCPSRVNNEASIALQQQRLSPKLLSKALETKQLTFSCYFGQKWKTAKIKTLLPQTQLQLWRCKLPAVIKVMNKHVTWWKICCSVTTRDHLVRGLSHTGVNLGQPRACLHGGGGPQAGVHKISHFNVITFTC